MVLCDEVAQLLDDSVDQSLSVSVRLPELGKDVVLSARLSHPADTGTRTKGREKRGTQGKSERSESRRSRAKGRKEMRRKQKKGKRKKETTELNVTVCSQCFVFPLPMFLCSNCPCRYQVLG